MRLLASASMQLGVEDHVDLIERIKSASVCHTGQCASSREECAALSAAQTGRDKESQVERCWSVDCSHVPLLFSSAGSLPRFSFFFFSFFCLSPFAIKQHQTEMFSSLVKNPAPTSPPLSPLMAPNKERKSRLACLGAESSFLFLFFFFTSQLAELRDGCLHNDKRRVGLWNWFTAPVYTSFTIHSPSPLRPKNVNPTQRRTFRPRRLPT